MDDQPKVVGWDADLGPMVAIPIPFWVRSWRTWSRWRPACYPCRVTFGSQAGYEQHYLRKHHGDR